MRRGKADAKDEQQIGENEEEDSLPTVGKGDAKEDEQG